MNGLDVIKEVERELPVETVRFHNACIWPILRRLVINAYNKKYHQTKDINVLSSRLPLLKAINCVLYGILYLPRLFKAKYFVFSASERRKKVGDYYEDRVIEGLVDNLKNDYLIIENPVPLWKHYKKNQLRNKRIISDSLLTGLVMVIGEIAVRLVKIESLDLIKEIEKRYDIRVPYKIYIKRYLGQFYLFRFFTAFKAPKMAFFVFPGSWYGVIHALKTRNVKIIELQHGIINEKHPAYNYFKKIDKTLLPDYLFTYGDRERQKLKNSNFLEDDHIVPTGYYFMDLTKNNLPNSAIAGHDKFSGSVVFSHQLEGEEFAIDFLKKVASLNPEISIIICPRRTTKLVEAVKKEGSKNLFVDEERTIYELMGTCDLHCTITSSTAVEAIGLNKPTILLNIKNRASNYFGGQEYKDFMTIIDNPESFEKAFNELRGKRNLISETSSYFFKSNFKDRINHFLEIGIQ